MGRLWDKNSKQAGVQVWKKSTNWENIYNGKGK